MRRGFIKLWRASVDNDLYFSEPFTKFQAWMDLLMQTNFKPGAVNVRGIIVKIERGQVLACEEFLAKRWKWSRGKVRRFLQYLESESVQQISQQKTNVCTIATVLKWSIYQSDGTANGTTDGTANGTTDGQQTDILKKDKNVKNGNKPRERSVPAAEPGKDHGKNNLILHRPEQAQKVELKDYRDFCKADLTSIACTITGEFSGPGAGFFSRELKTLAKRKGDAAACEIFREMLFRYWAEINSGEQPDSIGAGLTVRIKKTMTEEKKP